MSFQQRIGLYFDIVGRVDSLDELQQAVDSARAAVGLVIDHDFGKDRHRGAPAKALLIVVVLTFTLIQFTAGSIVKEREVGTSTRWTSCAA